MPSPKPLTPAEQRGYKLATKPKLKTNWDYFERALELALGTNAKWSREELKHRNIVTRKLFGKKRIKK